MRNLLVFVKQSFLWALFNLIFLRNCLCKHVLCSPKAELRLDGFSAALM